MKKHRNRIIGMVIVVMLVLGVVPNLAPTEAYAASNVSNADYEFVASTGTLTVKTNAGTTAWRKDTNIIGTGKADYKVVKSLVLKSGITAIGNSAFQSCTSLFGTLTIPAGVTSIGSNAFQRCSGLTSLDLSSYSGAIKEYVFERCTGLTGTLTIPAGVTSIGERAFYCCSSISALDLSSYSGPVGDRAFSGCDGLTGTLTIPAGVTSIGPFAFYACGGISALDLSSYSGSIGECAFAECGITGKLTIPAGVTDIGNFAFENCQGISSLDLSSYSGAIGEKAFSLCTGITGMLTIPSGVCYIQSAAFMYCRNAMIVLSGPTAPSLVSFWAYDVKAVYYPALWGPATSIPNMPADAIPYFGFDVETADYKYVAVTGELTVKTNEGTTLWRTDENIVGNEAPVYAFIREIYFLPNVTEIGENAFDGCRNLRIVMTSKAAPIFGADWANGVKAVYYPNVWGKVTSIANMPATAISYPPVLSEEKATGVTVTEEALSFTSDMAGTYYFVVCDGEESAPDVPTIQSQLAQEDMQGTGSIEASSAKTMRITGLDEGASYTAYIIVEDAIGNISDVSVVPFDTLKSLSNSGSEATLDYAGNAIDLSEVNELFTVDENAGTRIYNIETSDSPSGTGTIGSDGKTLTVTKAGTFTIGLVTAVTPTHCAGEKVTATLTVNKANQSAPAGLGKVNASASDASDGKITGVSANKDYEYKKDGAAEYVQVTSNERGVITGLGAGSYTVRAAATDLYNASADSEAIDLDVSTSGGSDGSVNVSGDGAGGKGGNDNSTVSGSGGSDENGDSVGEGSGDKDENDDSTVSGSGGNDEIGDSTDSGSNSKGGVGNSASNKTVKVGSVRTIAKVHVTRGRSVKLPVVVRPFNAANKGVTWSVKNKKIAKINAKTGKLRALRTGKTVVTVTSADGRKIAKCKVYVVKKAIALKGFKITPKKSKKLSVGKTLVVKVKLNPGRATGIVPKFKSSNPSVASIDATGMVEARKPGKTTITVKAGKLKKAFVLNVMKLNVTK